MNVYFGKIDASHLPKQLEEGYYQQTKNSSWFSNIQIGDLAYIIGGNKIQLWKAKEWAFEGTDSERLIFDVLINNLDISIKQFFSLKFIKLSKDIIVKTTRSTGASKQAFYKIDVEKSLIDKLGNFDIYKDLSNYRRIKVLESVSDLEANSYDLQIYYNSKDELLISEIKNCDQEILDQFIDNTAFIGKGRVKKDRALREVSLKSNLGDFLPEKVSIQHIYDAFMCPYKPKKPETNYWIVNGYDIDTINYCIENDVFIMQFQYEDQNNSSVTKNLRNAGKVKVGDKVLLFNKNRYYAQSTFKEVDIEFTKEKNLKEQISNKHVNDLGEIVVFEDADCFYEDLTLGNDFEGRWGQTLMVNPWEDFNSKGIEIKGIAGSVDFTQNSVMKVKDRAFFEKVSDILSGGYLKYNESRKIKNMIDILKHKKQIILQGPPGTGKTYNAKKIANEMTGSNEITESYITEHIKVGLLINTPTNYSKFEVIYIDDKLIKVRPLNVKNDYTVSFLEVLESFKNKHWEEKISDHNPNGNATYKIGIAKYLFNLNSNVKIIQFHPSYTYEDFVRGITVKNKGKDVVYETENKVFGQIIENASNSKEDFVLIIDEINRANLPSVLGELIYALEYRGESVDSMYAIGTDKTITIPNNLYIIGTMNTADRSVGHLDYAIRRRFAFVDVLPDDAPITNEKAKEFFYKVAALFVTTKDDKKVNSKFLASDFDYKDVQIGHSYFILENDEEKELKLKMQYEVLPILREYVKDGLLQESATVKIDELEEEFKTL